MTEQEFDQQVWRREGLTERKEKTDKVERALELIVSALSRIE